jgi:hypothetical protein
MTNRRIGLTAGVALFGASIGANAVWAETISHTQHWSETPIFSDVSNVQDPPGERHVFTLTYPQFHATRATLTRVVVQYHFDFELTFNLPAEGGGGSASMAEGLFTVNEILFGNFGGGGGGGGTGPATVVIPFAVPSGGVGDPPYVGEFVVDAETNPDALAQFTGTGTATVKWDAPIAGAWYGPPTGSVSLVAKASSYITVNYEYTAQCQNGWSWADADHDNDVDQTDFGFWQTCITTQGAASFEEGLACKCLDRGGLAGVDVSDYDAFVKCWSGPAVAADPSCTGA